MRQFAQNQELKTSVKEVKTFIRTAANKSINSVKNASNERTPWKVVISGSASTRSFYEIAGCANTLTFNNCKTSAYSYEIEQVPSMIKMEACALPCTGASYTGDVLLLFSPVDGLMSVYSAPNSLPSTSTFLGNSVGIKFFVIQDTSNSYLLSVNEKGAITETEL